VAETNTIHIKWIRSGIGFSHRQKAMIRALGFGRLNQVVERPDTPQTRGLVAALAHLVEVVEPPQQPKWAAVPEYAIRPRVEKGGAPVESPVTETDAPSSDAAPVTSSEPAGSGGE
jgi:large subunit ribosomal protein L30